MCRIRNLLISSPIPYSRCRELLDLTRQAFPCWPGRSAGPVGKPPPDRLRQLSYTYTIAIVTPGVRCCRERFCVFLHEGCAFVYARGADSCFSPVPEGRQCAFCCARGAGTCFFANARGAGRKQMAPTCRRRRGKNILCDLLVKFVRDSFASFRSPLVSRSLLRFVFAGCHPPDLPAPSGSFRPPDQILRRPPRPSTGGCRPQERPHFLLGSFLKAEMMMIHNLMAYFRQPSQQQAWRRRPG